jgi:hypothetical protein
MDGGSSIQALPVDPVNTTSSNFYYTYVTNGQRWMITAYPESQKQKTNVQVTPQIPNYPGVMARGSNLTLSPIFDYNVGLIGYWTFEEGSSTTASDSSGNNRNGSWSGNSTHYISGKVGSYAGQFATAGNDCITVSDPAGTLLTTDETVVLWLNPTSYIGVGNYQEAVRKEGNNGVVVAQGNGNWEFGYKDNGGGYNDLKPSNSTIPLSTWTQVAVMFNSASNTITLAINGVTWGTNSLSGRTSANNSANLYLGSYDCASRIWNGSLDDIRVYNRTLSTAEVLALYNSEK